MKREQIKQRVFEIISKADDGDRASKIFDRTIMTLIALSIVSIVLESFESINEAYGSVFRGFEIISVESSISCAFGLQTCCSSNRSGTGDVDTIADPLENMPDDELLHLQQKVSNRLVDEGYSIQVTIEKARGKETRE